MGTGGQSGLVACFWQSYNLICLVVDKLGYCVIETIIIKPKSKGELLSVVLLLFQERCALDLKNAESTIWFVS